LLIILAVLKRVVRCRERRSKQLHILSWVTFLRAKAATAFSTS